METDDDPVSRTELDSHANMPVVGKYALIIGYTGRQVEVNPFSPHYDSTTADIVDAALLYECPFTGQIYLFLVRNAIHVPAMSNNLIPPFIMREHGIAVRDTPKIQLKHPTEDDHAITFPDDGFRIPLSLWGIFSFFPTRKPTEQEADEIEDVYCLTPSMWNPHSDVYARNEENMLDWEGHMIDVKYRKKILLNTIEDDPALASSLQVSSAEATLVDSVFSDPPALNASSDLKGRNSTEVMSDDTIFARALQARSELSEFCMSVGATVSANQSNYIFEDDKTTEDAESADEDVDEDDEWFNETVQNIVTEGLSGELDLDAIMSASATHARPRKSVDAEHLSKIWKIDLDTAQRTLDVTTQSKRYTTNPKLSRNYGTGDRMLRYKRIKEFFFMDTFFATSKAGKSSRGHTCCQLFVTDKGFVYVVPMRSRSEVLQAVKQFAKEIGAPEVLVADPAGEQKSLPLRKFCNEIGTTLRALEEGTQWANRAELYIGLIKEAVRKDMKDSNCPLAFWDYCVERRARINNLTAKNLFQLHGSNAHTATLGEEGDISSLATYGFYEWAYAREKTNKFPFNSEILCRVLGPARGEGNEMSQWVLKANGYVVPRRSVRPLTTAELHSDVEKEKQRIFDKCIQAKWGTSMTPPPVKSDEFEEYEDDEESPRRVPDIEDIVDSTGRVLDQQPAYDKLINAEIAMNLDGGVSYGKVKGRVVGADGGHIGTYDDNPILNSMVYEVEFNDGQVKQGVLCQCHRRESYDSSGS